MPPPQQQQQEEQQHQVCLDLTASPQIKRERKGWGKDKEGERALSLRTIFPEQDKGLLLLDLTLRGGSGRPMVSRRTKRGEKKNEKFTFTCGVAEQV